MFARFRRGVATLLMTAKLPMLLNVILMDIEGISSGTHLSSYQLTRYSDWVVLSPHPPLRPFSFFMLHLPFYFRLGHIRISDHPMITS